MASLILVNCNINGNINESNIPGDELLHYPGVYKKYLLMKTEGSPLNLLISAR